MRVVVWRKLGKLHFAGLALMELPFFHTPPSFFFPHTNYNFLPPPTLPCLLSTKPASDHSTPTHGLGSQR